MELNALIESANQFKTAEEKLAFFIGYQVGITDTAPIIRQQGTPLKIDTSRGPGRGKITPRKVTCGHCGKKFVTNIACKRFCAVDDNQKCYQERKGKYELEARNKRLAEKAAKTMAKSQQLNLNPPPGAKGVLTEAMLRAKAEAENDRKMKAMQLRK